MTKEFAESLVEFRLTANSTEDPSRLLNSIDEAQSILLKVYQEHFIVFEDEFKTEICFVSNNTETDQDILFCKADDIFLRKSFMPGIDEAGMEGFLRAYRELEEMWSIYNQRWANKNPEAKITTSTPTGGNLLPPPPQ